MRERFRPTVLSGGLAGGVVTLAFVILHGVVISDIWFNVVPMVFAGVLCGVALVWSFEATGGSHSTSRWFAYNGACVLVLVALGGFSILTMEPEFTMASVMAMDDPLGVLLPRAVPPMIWGTILGTLAVWWVFGRRVASLAPILVSQALLVFLIGHNLAILGLVDIPATMAYLVFEFVGLTVFLGMAFAAAALVPGTTRRRAKPIPIDV